MTIRQSNHIPADAERGAEARGLCIGAEQAAAPAGDRTPDRLPERTLRRQGVRFTVEAGVGAARNATDIIRSVVEDLQGDEVTRWCERIHALVAESRREREMFDAGKPIMDAELTRRREQIKRQIYELESQLTRLSPEEVGVV